MSQFECEDGLLELSQFECGRPIMHLNGFRKRKETGRRIFSDVMEIIL